jgi:hypothetical protein
MPKLSAMLHNCALHAAIPSVLKHFATLAGNVDSQSQHRDAYNELKRTFCGYYNLNNDDTSFQQLYNFLSSNSFLENQLILGPVLRNFLVAQLEAKHPIDKEHDDVLEIGQLGKGKEYAEDENMFIGLTDKDKSEGKTKTFIPAGYFISLGYDMVQGNLFKPLGINVIALHKIKADGAIIKEENKDPFDDAIDTIELYHNESAEHYELEKVPTQDLAKGPLDTYAETLSTAASDTRIIGQVQDKVLTEVLQPGQINSNVQKVLDDLKSKITDSFLSFLKSEEDLNQPGQVAGPAPPPTTNEQFREAKQKFYAAYEKFKQHLESNLNRLTSDVNFRESNEFSEFVSEIHNFETLANTLDKTDEEALNSDEDKKTDDKAPYQRLMRCEISIKNEQIKERYQKILSQKYNESLADLKHLITTEIDALDTSEKIENFQQTKLAEIKQYFLTFRETAQKIGEADFNSDNTYLTKANEQIEQSAQQIKQQIQSLLAQKNAEIKQKALDDVTSAQQKITKSTHALDDILEAFDESLEDPQKILDTLTTIDNSIQLANDAVQAAELANQAEQPGLVDSDFIPVSTDVIKQKLEDIKGKQTRLQEKFNTLVAAQKVTLLAAQLELQQAVKNWITENLGTINPSSMITKKTIDDAIVALQIRDDVFQSLNVHIAAATQANIQAAKVGINDGLVDIEAEKQKIYQTIQGKTEELSKQLAFLVQQAQQDLDGIQQQLQIIESEIDTKLTEIKSTSPQEIQSALEVLPQIIEDSSTKIEALNEKIQVANAKAIDVGITELITIETIKDGMIRKISEKSNQFTQQLEQNKQAAVQKLYSTDQMITGILLSIEQAFQGSTDSEVECQTTIAELLELSKNTKQLIAEAQGAISEANSINVDTSSHPINLSLKTLTDEQDALNSKSEELNLLLEVMKAANQILTDATSKLTEQYTQLINMYKQTSHYTQENFNIALSSFKESLEAANTILSNPIKAEQSKIDELSSKIKQFEQELHQKETSLIPICTQAQQSLHSTLETRDELYAYLSKLPTINRQDARRELAAQIQQLTELKKATEQLLDQLPSDMIPDSKKDLDTVQVAISLATNQLQSLDQSASRKTVKPHEAQNPPKQQKQIKVFSMFKKDLQERTQQGLPLAALNYSQDINIATEELKKGIELTVPKTQHTFTFKTNDGNAAQAILTREQAKLTDNAPIAEKDEPIRTGICHDVINMIENVLSQGENLNLTTSDPYISAFGRYYIEYLKSLTDPKLAIHSNEQSLNVATTEQKAEFKKIVDEYHNASPLKNSHWVEEHLKNTTKALVVMSS